MKPQWEGRQMIECQGKDGMSATQAKTVAGRMRQRDRNSRISAYRCTSCGAWHVGSAPGMLRASGRRETGGFKKHKMLAENERFLE